MSTYKPLGRLTKFATVSMALQGVIDVLFMFVNRYLATSRTSIEHDLLAFFTAMLATAFQILTVTLFFVWIYRAATNVRSFGRTALQFTPAASVEWWFFPFANFIKPYQAVTEIVRASDPEVPIETSGDWTYSAVPWVVRLWWLFFLGRFLAHIVVSYSDTLSENMRAAPDLAGLAIRALLTFLAAGACIGMMWLVAKRQDALAAKVDLTSNLGHVPQRDVD